MAFQGVMRLVEFGEPHHRHCFYCLTHLAVCARLSICLYVCMFPSLGLAPQPVPSRHHAYLRHICSYTREGSVVHPMSICVVSVHLHIDACLQYPPPPRSLQEVPAAPIGVHCGGALHAILSLHNFLMLHHKLHVELRAPSSALPCPIFFCYSRCCACSFSCNPL
jgi:hypothetical protein